MLKQNEQLEKKNKELVIREKSVRREIANVKTQAEKEINKTKQEYKDKLNSLLNREHAVERRENAVNIRNKTIDKEVETKAIQKIQNKSAELKLEYKRLRTGYYIAFMIAVLYGILVTCLTAITTVSFAADFREFIMAIVKGVCAFFTWCVKVSDIVSGVGDLIPQTAVASVIHWFLWLTVMAIIIGLAAAVLYFVISAYVKFIKETQADEITIYVALVDLAMIVFGADLIKSIISINLLFLLVIAFGGYTLIRCLIQIKNKELKDNILVWAGTGALCITVFGIMIHFIGAWVIIAIPIGMMIAVSNEY
ncbi:MAG: hypothetical protein HUJ72_09475 [Blautia sp.]|nr:hypothetical protein [Blautia sp.]